MATITRILNFIQSMLIKASIVAVVRNAIFVILLVIAILFSIFLYTVIGTELKNMSIHAYSEVLHKQFEFIEYWLERRVEYIDKLSYNKKYFDQIKGNVVPVEVKRALDAIISEQGVYGLIAICNADGKVLYSTNSKVTIKTEIINKTILSDDILVHSSVAVKQEKHSIIPYLPVSAPIKNTAYYIICYIDLRSLLDSIQMVDLGKGGVSLIDDKGRTYLCSNSYNQNVNHKPDDEMNDKRHAMDLPVSVKKCLRTHRHGMAEYVNNYGIKVIGLWKWLSYFKTMILFEVPYSVVMKTVYRSLIFLAIMIGVIVAGSFGLAFMIAKNIKASLSRFIEVFSKAALGRIDQRYPVVFSINGNTIFQYDSAHNDYIRYEQSTDKPCFFWIGSIARHFNRQPLCKWILEKRYKSCTQCPVYKDNFSNEMDLIGVWFNNLMDKLSLVIKKSNELCFEILTAADEINTSTIDFSSNANDLASSAEEIMATVEQLDSSFTMIIDKVEMQNKNIKATNEKMDDLKKAIKSINNEIVTIQNATEEFIRFAKEGNEKLHGMMDSMNKVSRSSSDVMSIINIIDEISEQINLLSLNASIEAARAGEAGKGFAVVAQEISKLADQTAKRVKDIDSVIKENNSEISRSIQAIDEASSIIKKFVDGFNTISSLMNDMNGIMQNSVDRVRAQVQENAQRIFEMAQDIAIAIEEQKKASDEIVKSISIVNESSQIIAARSEELSASSQNMNSEINVLKQELSFFEF
ncbi:MAG: methyl-accepting chemotaxis protein [Spirochaetota bacterium]